MQRSAGKGAVNTSRDNGRETEGRRGGAKGHMIARRGRERWRVKVRGWVAEARDGGRCDQVVEGTSVGL